MTYFHVSHLQMSTSAGWDGVLNGIIDEEDCTKDNHETGEAGNCGNTAMGIAFLLSYLVISFLIIINMYIAVILENYSQVSFFKQNILKRGHSNDM
jgi:voltage-gated sodium channel type II alpha